MIIFVPRREFWLDILFELLSSKSRLKILIPFDIIFFGKMKYEQADFYVDVYNFKNVFLYL